VTPPRSTTVPPGARTRQLPDKLRDLDRGLRELDAVVLAFSGGADSAFLLAAAALSLGGDRVLAVTSASPALPAGELDAAIAFAEGFGVDHLRIDTDELSRPGYRANGPDRCYHCKSELLDRLVSIACERGYSAVLTGTNADDVAAPHRPGLRAAAERCVVTPLADVGFTKDDVRAASKQWNLPTWDKPQAACLASRVAYGVTVDADRLHRIDRAETAARAELRAAGIPVVNLRVRDTGQGARLEVDPEWVAAVSASPGVAAAVTDCGFATVLVDERGFRSGSMNEALVPAQAPSPEQRRSSWNLPVVD
jgi:pyridinium-3,5-biscarboxylic acid mononucleotide sulfurtransferase